MTARPAGTEDRPAPAQGPRLRVLQIVAAPMPTVSGRIGVNGPERRAANTARHWGARGIDVAIAYPRRGNLWPQFAAAGVPLIDFEISGKFDFGAIGRIAGIVRAQRAELIHTQGPGSLDALATAAARRARVPIVVTRPVVMEDEVFRAPWRRAVYGWIDGYTRRRAACIIAVSQAGLDHLRTFNRLPVERSRLIYNGIDLARFQPRVPSAADGRPGGQAVCVGMVAQLTDVKGWPDFLQVIARTRSLGLNVRGLVVGDGPMRAELEALAGRLGVAEQVQFTGQQPDVRPWLAQCDIFLFSSYREGLSVAIIEALASGLPVVATSVGGIREQVEEGRNGHIVAPGALDALVERCAQLVREPALRAHYGRISREIAEERFSETRMMDAHAECYRAVAGPGSAPAGKPMSLHANP